MLGVLSISGIGGNQLYQSIQSNEPTMAAQANLTGSNLQIDTQDGAVSNLQLNPTNTEISVDYDNFNQELENNTDEFDVQLEFKPVGTEFNSEITVNPIQESPLTEATDRVRSVSFSSDNELIAYGGNDDTVYIHDTSDWTEIAESPLTETGFAVSSVSFSSDNSYIAYGALDYNVYIEEVSGGSASFELFGDGLIDAGNTPSDTVTKVYNNLLQSTVDFSDHSSVSTDYSEFEPETDESEKVTEVDFRVSAESTSYTGLDAEDEITLTITVTDEDAQISVGGNIELDGSGENEL